jgi:hypothetical protein
MPKINFNLFSIFLFGYFYAGWFGCVYLAKTDFAWLSLAIPGLLVVLLWLNRSLRPTAIVVALLIAAVGTTFDATLSEWGYLQFANHEGYVAPVWLISMWLLFAFSMLHLSAKWNLPLWLQFPLGFILGPLTYKSGEWFALLEFSHAHTFWLFALFWSLAFPLTTTLAKKVL